MLLLNSNLTLLYIIHSLMSMTDAITISAPITITKLFAAWGRCKGVVQKAPTTKYWSGAGMPKFSTLHRHWVLWGPTVYLTASHGPLTRSVKLLVAHVPGMPGGFSPPPRVSDPDMHHSTCVTLVPWCMPGSLTSGFLWIRWWEKRFQHSRRMHNPQFYVSVKRPMASMTRR